MRLVHLGGFGTKRIASLIFTPTYSYLHAIQSHIAKQNITTAISSLTDKITSAPLRRPQYKSYRQSSKVFWVAIALIINIVALSLLFSSANKASYAVTISLFLLSVALLARNYLITKLLYLLGERTKSYFLHYVIYRIGFFHRSAAISCIIWLIIHFILSEKTNPYYSEAIAILLIISLLIVAGLAVNIIRRNNHHIFEFTHRFLGYSSLILLISYYFLDAKRQGLFFADAIFDYNFYLILFILLLVVEPWIRVRKIQVESKVIGKNIFSLTIPESPDYGTFSRISLFDGEFHSFANSIYDFDDRAKSVLYVSAVGSSTKKALAFIRKLNELHRLTDAPRFLVRPHRGYGFMRHVTAYDKVVIVATGGAIAPVIPHFVLNNKTEIKFLWITHDPKFEFPEDFLIRLGDLLEKRKILMELVNTTALKHCNLGEDYFVDHAVDFCKAHNPQAVFIITNPKFANKVSKHLDAHNIRSYMPTFDS